MTEPLERAALAQLVRLVDPHWQVREVTPVSEGRSRLARLVVATDDGPRDCICKAPPAGEDDGGIAADARLLALLDARTSIPVPTVLGAVDEHAELPTPWYLATAVDGTGLPYEAVGRLDDDVLRTLARETGRHLGELHGVDAVDRFGLVRPAGLGALDGQPPAGTVDEVAVPEGTADWRTFLEGWVDRELSRHADSRFSSLTPRLREWFEPRVETVEDGAAPVLCRNDHGLHNLLIDPQTGHVRATLDWAYTLATTPAFDVAFATYIYGGGFLTGTPDLPDRRPLVREALRAGYREVAPERVDAVAERPLYELLAAVRVMNDFELLAPQLPSGTVEPTAAGLRADATAVLET
ncbi:MAG: phosphotransferase family protein [Haloglomus sp.]